MRAAADMGPLFDQLFPHFRDLPRLNRVRRLDHAPDREEFLALQAEGYPVVYPFQQALDLEEALLRLSEQGGDQTWKFRQPRFESPEEYAQADYLNSTSGVEAAHALQEGRLPGYIGNQELAPALAGALGASPPEFLASQLQPPRLWLGSPNSATRLHKDGVDNFALQVTGIKHWYLFPIGDAPQLDYRRRPGLAQELEFRISHRTDLPPSDPQFIVETGLTPLELELRGGEALYLPAGWGHYVENRTASLMVNYFYRLECFAKHVPRIVGAKARG